MSTSVWRTSDPGAVHLADIDPDLCPRSGRKRTVTASAPEP